MIDPQTLYSQTPGAYHMGMGYAGVGGMQDAFGGTMFGTGTLGTNAMIAARQFAGYAPGLLTAMAGLSHMGMFPNGVMGGLFGAAGQLTRFGGLPLLALQAGVGVMQRGADSAIYAGQAMSRAFGERDAGGRLGLGASRSAAADYGRVFRDLSTSAEMLTNDAELKSIMTKMTDMQLLTTSRSASDMTGRFKKMVETMRDMSIDIGTTLDGVMPIFQRHLQMGFLSARDIHTSARHVRGVAGVGIGNTQENVQVFQGTQSGVARAHGGRGDIAARHAADVLGLVQYQMLDQDFDMPTRLQHAGLGVGRDGAMAFAEHFMEGTSALMQNTQFGSAVMAVLGAKAGNRFIGGIDAQQLARLRNGEISDIVKEAAERTRGEEALLSFEAQRRSGLGADIQSQMGMGDMVKVLNSVLAAHGMQDPNQKLILLQQLTGQTGRVSKLMLDFVEKTTETVVGDYEKQLAEVTVRNTLAGNTAARFSIDSQLGRAARDISNLYPIRWLRNAGADFTTGVGDVADNISDQWWQRGVWGAGGALFSLGYDGQRRGINTRTRNSDAYKQALQTELSQTPVSISTGTGTAANANMSTWKDYMGDAELESWMLSDETAGSRTLRNVTSSAVGIGAGVGTGIAAFGAASAVEGAALVVGAAFAGAAVLTVGAALLAGYLVYSMFDDPKETLQSAADRYEAAKKKLTEQLDEAVKANRITEADKENKLAQLKRAYDRKVYAIKLGITGKTLLEQQEKISQNIGKHLQRNDMMGGADLEWIGGDIQSSFLYELYENRDYGALSAVAGVLEDTAGTANDMLRSKALASDSVLDAYVKKEFGIELNDQSRGHLRDLLRLDKKDLAKALKNAGTKQGAETMLRTQAQAQLQEVYSLFGETAQGASGTEKLQTTLNDLATSTNLSDDLLQRGVTAQNLPRAVELVERYTRALNSSKSNSDEAFAVAIQGLTDPVSTPAGQLNAARSSAEDNLKTAQVLAEVTRGMQGLSQTIRDIQNVQAQEQAFFAEFSKQLTDRLKGI